MIKDKILLAKEQVNLKLKDHPKRLAHVYGVAETAVKLANIYQLDVDKMMIAGLYHDYAKYETIRQQELTDQEYQIVLSYPVMFHAFYGAYLMEKNLDIHDQEMIEAIKCHVWGKPKMTPFEQILFISDYCEPNRDFIDTKEIFEMATKDLDQTTKHCMAISMNDLLNRGLVPSPLQIEAYQYYLEETHGKN